MTASFPLTLVVFVDTRTHTLFCLSWPLCQLCIWGISWGFLLSPTRSVAGCERTHYVQPM